MTLPLPLTGPSAGPAGGGDPRSIVVFLHGYGSNGDDLIGLAPYWKAALPHTLFIAPNSPQACPGQPGGYQWWNLMSRSEEERTDGVGQSAPALNAFIDAQLVQYGLAASKLALVGFSQGTMMALHVGPRRAQALAGIAGYSGLLVNPRALPKDVASKPPVILIHGDADLVVPVTASYEAHGVLMGLEFETALHISSRLGHSIDEAGLRHGGAFLSRVLES
ncbi:MAG: phospholipase [Alphaproteobacteria bacterium]|jgi:phospholipase/carboxylesterase